MKFFLLVLLAVFAARPLGAQPKVEAPVPVRTVPPVYPAELRREGVAGLVVVSCTVDLSGNVTEAAVDRSTHPGFNESALQALKKWKFKPALVDGLPVVQKIFIPLKFILQET